MVLVSQGVPSGPLSLSQMERLQYVRFAVMGLWLCGFARLIVDSPLNGLVTLFSAVCGTYTFMNDKSFANCYNFMFNNCIMCGPGGAQCMGPFMSICVINVIFDCFRLGGIIQAGLLLLLPSLSIPLSLSIILQLYSFFGCLRVYKDMVQPYDSPLPRNTADNTRPFLQGVPSSRAEGFVPFGGEGRRLG